jgi:hypothetical protein
LFLGFVVDMCKNKGIRFNEDQMGRKVSLYLILGLVLFGFVVAPAAANVYIGECSNGNTYVYTDSDASLRIFHFENGTWTRIYYDDPSSRNQYAIPSIPKVTPGNTNSYSNSLVPQTNPSTIIVKPLPTQATIKTIPAVKYVPASSSFVPSSQLTPTDPGNDCPICTPVKIDITDSVSDYPLYLRALSVGDIYYLIIEVNFTANSKILSQVEPYFIDITRAEYCAENSTVGVVGGWIYPDKVDEVIAINGVFGGGMPWPPYGYEDRGQFLYPPYISYTEVQVTKLNNQFTRPSNNIIRIPQTGFKSSGASRFTQYIK